MLIQNFHINQNWEYSLAMIGNLEILETYSVLIIGAKSSLDTWQLELHIHQSKKQNKTTLTIFPSN